MDIRYQLRDLRIKEGFTQQQIADAVGLSRTSITNMEQARQSLSFNGLICIAHVLGYTVDIKFKRN